MKKYLAVVSVVKPNLHRPYVQYSMAVIILQKCIAFLKVLQISTILVEMTGRNKFMWKIEKSSKKRQKSEEVIYQGRVIGTP